MKNTTRLLILSTLALVFSANSFAQTFAPKNRECAYEIAVPSFNCFNPRGADVRLYIMEFQTCKDNSITQLDRSITGMNILSQYKLEDLHSISSDDIVINYSDKRILIDADNRVDNLSFLLPTDVTMKDGDNTIEMKITNKTEPDFQGAASDQVHFKGTFQILKADGQIAKKGKLNCFVTR